MKLLQTFHINKDLVSSKTFSCLDYIIFLKLEFYIEILASGSIHASTGYIENEITHVGVSVMQFLQVYYTVH